MKAAFARFSQWASEASGAPGMFGVSLLACVIWLAVGPLCHWDDLWQLWPTSILTWTTWFLVVLIQHTQNRDKEALQKKLDELIRAVDKADNRLIGLEKQPPEAEVTGGDSTS
jgi:low affinity Fe/Cu permease